MGKRPRQKRSDGLLSSAEACEYLAKRGYPEWVSPQRFREYMARPNGLVLECVREGNYKFYDPKVLLIWAEAYRHERKRPVPKQFVGHEFRAGHAGHARVAGALKKRGHPSVPKAVKEMVLEALNGPKLGGVKYFEWLGETHPQSFTVLLAKIMPTQISATVKSDVRSLSTAELLAALNAEGVAIEEDGAGESGVLH